MKKLVKTLGNSVGIIIDMEERTILGGLKEGDVITMDILQVNNKPVEDIKPSR